MRVLFVSDGTFAKPASGSERVLYQQAYGLAQLGYHICAITRGASQDSARIQDVDGVREALFGIPSRVGIRTLWRAFRFPISYYRQLSVNGGFDWVVGHQPLSYLSLLVTHSLRDIPTIYVFHSPWHQEYLFRYKKRRHMLRRITANIRQAVERICVMHSDKVITLSEYMREKLHALHRVQPDKSIVIPGGVDLQRFRPPADRAKVKEEFGFPPGALHLLTVRNLEPRMGLDNLLESLRMISPGGPAIHLTIVGEGPEKKNLREMVVRNRLEDQVTMTGAVSTSKLVKYYGAADFFVLPTRSLEGFGLVTPEAMACGTPVVGTPVGGTKEILSKFEPGFLFADNTPQAIADGIERVAGQFDLTDNAYFELRRRCREFVRENYSWDRHVRKLLSVMNSVRHRPGSHPAARGQ